MISSTPILKNADLQRELDTNGFIISNFLDQREIQELQSLFDKLHSNNPDIPNDILFTGLHNPDIEYRTKMDEAISSIIKPNLNRVFRNIQTITFTFQIKGIGPHSELGVHQDWSFSKEEKGFRTYTFWIPLVDSTEDNGTLSIIPESHIKYDCVRGANIKTHITGKEASLMHLLMPIEIQAGQLMLFDSALIHSSSANFSSKIRVSVMTNILNSDASIHLYFPSEQDSNLITEYEVSNNFFLSYKDYKNEYNKPPRFARKTRDVRNNTLNKPTVESSKLHTRSSNWFKRVTDGLF